MKDAFIKTPNLPENKVTLACVGDFPEIKEALKKEGINTLSFYNPELNEEVCKHQDMLLCHIGGKNIFLDAFQNKAVLEEEGFSVFSPNRLQRDYPYDVKLNVAVGKSLFIYNPKTIDPLLFEKLSYYGYTGYETKQGYSKCSVCFISENAAITEDASIYEALKSSYIDTLLISKGDIYLSPKHYGFFGGSTGKTDKHTLAITGSLCTHRDEMAIRSFCEKHGVSIKELTQGKIIDIGGIIPLKERE